MKYTPSVALIAAILCIALHHIACNSIQNMDSALTVLTHGIAFTAKPMNSADCLDTFFKDLPAHRIFPIVVTLQNNTEQTLTIAPDRIMIKGATLLTPSSLESEISSTRWTALLFYLIFFPIGCLFAYQLAQLQELTPIIEKCSIPDSSTVIKPHETLQTVLFARFEYPKDAEGKTMSFIPPNSFDITITLKNASFFSWQKPITLNAIVAAA